MYDFSSSAFSSWGKYLLMFSGIARLVSLGGGGGSKTGWHCGGSIGKKTQSLSDIAPVREC